MQGLVQEAQDDPLSKLPSEHLQLGGVI